ncbi:MAG: outer membrane beta-barrel protein [Cyclobacteriaceae bacterium]
MKYLITSSFLIFSIHSLFGQYSIRGRIIDEQNAGVPFANVLLLNSVDSSLIRGSITDEHGNYLIPGIAQGDFIIQSSMVGFERYFSERIATANKPEVKLGDIILKESSTELDAVVVEGEKPLYEQKIDRMVVNVQSSPIIAGNSVLEVLEKSPGVLVDRQNYAVRMNGKSGVSMMINGKMTRMDMTALFNMMDGMPSNNVEKIELITTPPANFDAEGNAGFINIVLKRLDYEGINGSISAMIGRTRRSRFSGGGNINYRSDKFNVFADVNTSETKLNQIAETYSRIENDQYDFASSNYGDRLPGVTLTTGRVGVDYYLSSKTVIGVLGTVFLRNWKGYTENEAYYDVEPGIDTLFNGIRIDNDIRKQYTLNFNLQHDFSENNQLNMDVDYFIYRQRQPQSYSNEYVTEDQQAVIPENIRMLKETPLNIFVGKIDYRMRISEFLSLELGAKATLNTLENEVLFERVESGNWQIDPIFSDFTNMEENIVAGYTSFNAELSEKISLKAGLRYEHTLTDIRDKQGQSMVYRNYQNFFPTAYLSRKLTEKSSINLAYSYRISRPTFFNLAPFVAFLDPKTFFTGNARLFPALAHSLKTSYSLRGMNLSFEYSKIFNSIANFSASRIPDTDITMLSTINLDNTTLYNLSLSLPVTVTSWWEMSNNFSGISSHIRSDYFDGYLDISNLWYSLNSTQSFSLPQKYSIQLSGLYFSESLFGVSRAKPYGMVSLGIRKEFENNWGSLNLGFTDIFRTNIQNWIVDRPGFYNSAMIDFDIRAIQLTYTNSFGNKKLKSRSNRETGAADDLKRL